MEEIPLERWVACFSRNGKRFMRQFFAAGYYEAYDTVLTYAERRRVDILWFKERRLCNKRQYAELESFCTFCNLLFNDREPIPCSRDDCKAVFCSRGCLNEHLSFRHRL